MKRVLVITYAWPPVSGGGVQRILNFCKHLKEYGYQPTVITSHCSNYYMSDESLAIKTQGIQVYKVDYWFNPVRWFSSNNKEQNKKSIRFGLFQKIKRKLLEFIWLNFFIIDAKVGWYFPVRKKIKEILKNNNFDALITTAPPYTVHLLGSFVKKKFNLPWLVDMRDPWVELVSYNITYRFGFVKAINRYLEKKVLSQSDAIVVVGEDLAALLKKRAPSRKISIIYNGYDRDDFQSMVTKKISRFRLGYYGHISDQRIPLLFISCLSKTLINDMKFARDFRLDIYGRISPETLIILESSIPAENMKFHGNIDHARLIEEYGKEQVFLLLLNNTGTDYHNIPGKFFEYLHAGWPILGIGPTAGEVAKTINETHSGKMFDFQDTDSHVKWLLEMFEKWKNGEIKQKMTTNPRYDRREQAKSLSRILDRITNN